MSPLHRSAAEGYAANAATCAGRLREDLRLGVGRTVLDLDAGTGKFSPLLRATDATVVAGDAHEDDTPRCRSQDWRRILPAPGFGPLAERRFPHGHTAAPEDVIVGRALSGSVIAALPPDVQAEIPARARDLIARALGLAGQAVVT